MMILSRLWSHTQVIGDTRGATAIQQIVPLAWQHINFYGRYEFTNAAESIDLDTLITTLVSQPFDLIANE